jgi:COP9 signalosome complex subunit 2
MGYRTALCPSYLLKHSDKRLSAKTNLKLAKLWLDRGEFARLNRVGSYVFATSSQFQSPYS